MSEACKILNLLPRARFLRLLNLGLPASVRQGSGGGVLRGPSKHTGAEWLGEWLSVHVCDPFARRFPDSCGFDGGGGGGGVNLHDAAPGSAKDVGGSVSGCVWWLATAEMSALILRALHVVASSWSASSGRPVGGDGGVGGEGECLGHIRGPPAPEHLARIGVGELPEWAIVEIAQIAQIAEIILTGCTTDQQQESASEVPWKGHWCLPDRGQWPRCKPGRCAC